METFEGMTCGRLAELLAAFPRLRVAVVGDFFLDEYLDVDPALAEASVETGKTAHQVVGVRHSPGAAGTVVANLAALGAGRLSAVGLTGEDGPSYDLRRDLAQIGCDTEYLAADPQRMTPTYLKPRDRGDLSLAGEHPRYDTKNRTPTSQATQQTILRSLECLLPQLDALVALDQVDEAECGVVTAAVREFLARTAARWPRVVFWADSRRRIRQFRGVIIKPNQFEAAGRQTPAPATRSRWRSLRPCCRPCGRRPRPRFASPWGPPACWWTTAGSRTSPRSACRTPSIRPARATAPRRARCSRWPRERRWPRRPCWATSRHRSPSSSLLPPAQPAPTNSPRAWRCGRASKPLHEAATAGRGCRL